MTFYLFFPPRLRGMNETCVKFDISSANADESSIKKKMYQVANVLQVPSINEESSQHLMLKFAGQTLANKSLVLITLKLSPLCEADLSINCEKMVVGSMLAKEIKQHLQE